MIELLRGAKVDVKALARGTTLAVCLASSPLSPGILCPYYGDQVTGLLTHSHVAPIRAYHCMPGFVHYTILPYVG